MDCGDAQEVRYLPGRWRMDRSLLEEGCPCGDHKSWPASPPPRIQRTPGCAPLPEGRWLCFCPLRPLILRGGVRLLPTHVQGPSRGLPGTALAPAGGWRQGAPSRGGVGVTWLGSDDLVHGLSGHGLDRLGHLKGCPSRRRAPSPGAGLPQAGRAGPLLPRALVLTLNDLECGVSQLEGEAWAGRLALSPSGAKPRSPRPCAHPAPVAPAVRATRPAAKGPAVLWAAGAPWWPYGEGG